MTKLPASGKCVGGILGVI